MRSETSFDLDGDLIIVDAVVVGPSGRANIQLVLDTGAVLTTLVPTEQRPGLSPIGDPLDGVRVSRVRVEGDHRCELLVTDRQRHGDP
jgi:hypothetical protein